jgi:hypothetical protein
MRKILLALWCGALGCAAKGPAGETTPQVAVKPECKLFKGRYGPITPGVSELRGTVEIPVELENQTLYVALDYSTGDGVRHSIAVGTLVSPERTLRVQCVVPTPGDAAFWKWVLIAPPAESCGYYGETTGEVETAVNVTCEASRVFAWDAYKGMFPQ